MGGKSSGETQPINPFLIGAADVFFNRPNQFTPFGSSQIFGPGTSLPQQQQVGFTGGLTPEAQNLLGTTAAPTAPTTFTNVNQQQFLQGQPQAPSGTDFPGFNFGTGFGDFFQGLTPPPQPTGPTGLPELTPNQFSSILGQVKLGEIDKLFARQGINPFTIANPGFSQVQQVAPALLGLQNLGLTSQANALASLIGGQQSLPSGPLDTSGLPGFLSQAALGGLPDITSRISRSQLPGTVSGVNRSNLPQLLTQLRTGQLPSLATGVNRGGLPGTRSGLPSALEARLNQASRPIRQGELDLSFAGAPGLPESFNAFRDDISGAIFERGRNLLDPVLQRREEGLRQTLADQGFQAGSEGFGDEFNIFNTARDQQFNDLALRAITQGGAEASRALQGQLALRGTATGEAERLRSAGLENILSGAGLDQQAIANQFQEAGLQNLVRSQLFGENVTNIGLAGDKRRQLVGEQLASAGLSSQARNQLFGELFQNANLQNAVRQQLFGELGFNAQLGNQAQNQLAQQQFQQANLQNLVQQAGFGQLLQERQLPFNELNLLSALAGGAGSQFGGGALGGGGGGFSPTDITGAFALNQQANAQNAAAQQANSANILGAGAGLTSALLGGAAASPGGLGSLFGSGAALGGLGGPLALAPLALGLAFK